MGDPSAKPWKPYNRWEGFGVYGNPDGTFHILVIDDNGGRIFCDQFDSREEAEWTAALLNAAIGSDISHFKRNNKIQSESPALPGSVLI